MLIVYILGSILVWAAIAFGLAALNRGTASREDAHLVAWITAFWPVTLPVIAVSGIVLCAICGGVWLLEIIGKMCTAIGARYIDFLHGEKKPPTLTEKINKMDKKIRGIEKRYGGR
jgi:hypothetical protein